MASGILSGLIHHTAASSATTRQRFRFINVLLRYFVSVQSAQKENSFRSFLFALKRLQKVDQVLHLLLGKPDLKTLTIKTHQLLKVGCNSVVKVWGTRRQTSRNEALASADIAALTAD